ncbi:Uncharacterized protein TCM_046031 [Theobroma cacao]|uniref:Uncharacterized protein n=1 Tax=Theobroma cacao TaxID=3641 RepID=S1S420_THECC|nr:Uncharacterized protein TCM_046031 [Theobroma cacao]
MLNGNKGVGKDLEIEAFPSYWWSFDSDSEPREYGPGITTSRIPTDHPIIAFSLLSTPHRRWDLRLLPYAFHRIWCRSTRLILLSPVPASSSLYLPPLSLSFPYAGSHSLASICSWSSHRRRRPGNPILSLSLLLTPLCRQPPDQTKKP